MSQDFTPCNAVLQLKHAWDTRREIVSVSTQLNVDLWKGIGVGPTTDLSSWSSDFLKNLLVLDEDRRSRNMTKLRAVAKTARERKQYSALMQDLAEIKDLNAALQVGNDQLEVLMNRVALLLPPPREQFFNVVAEIAASLSTLRDKEEAFVPRVELIAKALQVLEFPEEQFEALLLPLNARSNDSQGIADRFVVLQAELHQLVRARQDALERAQGIPAVHALPHTPEGAEARIVDELALLRSLLEEVNGQVVNQAGLIKEITLLKEQAVTRPTALYIGEGEATVLVDDLFSAVQAMVLLREETIDTQGIQLGIQRRLHAAMHLMAGFARTLEQLGLEV